jgi:uncharacterized protein
VKRPLRQICHIDDLASWVKYQQKLCRDCRARCCSLAVEVRIEDLIGMGLADPFEADEPARLVARRLQKAGIIDHFNARSEIFTLARRAGDDCIFLDPQSRRCTIYPRRPATCRNHPQVGPRPGYCAYQTRTG